MGYIMNSFWWMAIRTASLHVFFPMVQLQCILPLSWIFATYTAICSSWVCSFFKSVVLPIKFVYLFKDVNSIMCLTCANKRLIFQVVCDRANVHTGDRLAPNSRKRKWLVRSFDKTKFPQFQEFDVQHTYLLDGSDPSLQVHSWLRKFKITIYFCTIKQWDLWQRHRQNW